MSVARIVFGLVALTLTAFACNSGDGVARTDAGMRSVRSAGLKLSATASGAVIEAVLENVGERPLTVLGGVPAPNRVDYDAFYVRIGSRDLRFSGPRNSSGSGVYELKPGESVHQTLDLVKWAKETWSPQRQPFNPGGPLEPGRYRASLSYRVAPGEASWSGELVLEAIPITVP